MSETEEYEYPRSRYYTWSEDMKQFAISMPADGEVERARAEGTHLISIDEDGLAMRTCWVCNPAHIHLIEKTADFVLNCFGCGRWYFQQIDITIYEENEDAE